MAAPYMIIHVRTGSRLVVVLLNFNKVHVTEILKFCLLVEITVNVTNKKSSIIKTGQQNKLVYNIYFKTFICEF